MIYDFKRHGNKAKAINILKGFEFVATENENEYQKTGGHAYLVSGGEIRFKMGLDGSWKEVWDQLDKIKLVKS